MEPVLENLDSLERKVTICADFSEIKKNIEKKLFKLSKTVFMKGFRKGRVPISVINDRYGKEVYGDEVNSFISKTFYDYILQNKDIKLAHIINFNSFNIEGDQIKFSVNFEVFPSLEMPKEFSSINILKNNIVYSDKDFSLIEDNIVLYFSEFTEVDDTINYGHSVRFKSKCTEKGNIVPEFTYEDKSIFLREELLDHIICSIQGVLIGKTKGCKINTTVSVPDGYMEASYVGRTFDFELEVLSVNTVKRPDLDDKFLEKVGSYETLDMFKEDVRKNVLLQAENYCHSDFSFKLYNALLPIFDFNCPYNLILNRVSSFCENAKLNLESLSEERSKFLFEQEEISLRKSIIFNFLVKHFDITVSEEEFKDKADRVSITYSNPKEFFQNLDKDKNFRLRLMNELLEFKLFAKIAETTDVKLVDFSLINLMRLNN